MLAPRLVPCQGTRDRKSARDLLKDTWLRCHRDRPTTATSSPPRVTAWPPCSRRLLQAAIAWRTDGNWTFRPVPALWVQLVVFGRRLLQHHDTQVSQVRGHSERRPRDVFDGGQLAAERAQEAAVTDALTACSRRCAHPLAIDASPPPTDGSIKLERRRDGALLRRSGAPSAGRRSVRRHRRGARAPSPR